MWVTNGLLPAIAYSRALMCSYKQVWGLTRGRARTRLWRERHLEYKGVVASQNCASQRSPKISIVLELRSADREYVERCWKEAIAYNSAMAFADQQRAGSCGRYRHSCDKGAVLEGFPHRRAGEAGSDGAGREPHCTRACRKGREASAGGDKF